MRAVELRAPGERLRIVDRPIPEPAPGSVRVRVQACGVCGSDVFLQDGGFGAHSMPLVPGHEACGIVDALGPDVHSVNIGDQVAIYYIDSPPDSRFASMGRPNIGPDIKRMGVDVDGAFAEFIVRPLGTLIVPPRPVAPVTLAVLTDAVATPWHALTKIGQLKQGETLVVFGIGGIGSNAVQIGKYLGARVIGVSRSPWKRKLAASLGADHVVEAGAAGMLKIRRICGRDGPEVVIQCAGSAAVDQEAIAIAGPAGRVILVGSSAEPFQTRSVDLIWRELSLLGSRGFTPEDIREVIALYLEGRIRTDHLISKVRPLEEANEALEDLRLGKVLRTVLVP